MTDMQNLCAAVSETLWLQREALEELLFKLVEEQLVVSGAATRWLARADDEVRRAAERVQDGEIMRSVHVEQLTRELHLDADVSLADLAAACPEPWDAMLGEHRVALRDLTLEIQAVTKENRRLLDAGAQAVRQTLDAITSSVSTYDARGEQVTGRRGPMLLDEQL